MAGKIREIIDLIIQKRSKGNATIAVTTKTKLMLKGINPDAYDTTSPDDTAIEKKLKDIGIELGIQI